MNEKIAKELIDSQFPQYKELKIEKIASQGHDNTTFQLGANYTISFPNKDMYQESIQSVYDFLPKIQEYLSIKIPIKMHIGNPSTLFSYRWSIQRYIEGQSSNLILESIDLNQFATELAKILKEFKNIKNLDRENKLRPSPKNFFRGGDLIIYKSDIEQSLSILKDEQIDKVWINKIWKHAISVPWKGENLFVHGDIAQGNIIFNDNKLEGIIDFGTMACGDPACDLMMAWNTFTGESRAIFKKIVDYDNDTWIRGMAWTLWKGLLEISQTSKSNANDWKNPQKVIEEIIEDYKNNYT